MIWVLKYYKIRLVVHIQILPKIAHGGQNTIMFNEISLDAPECPIGRIMFYTSENVKNRHNFVTNNDIQP